MNKYIELRIEALTGYIHFQYMENFQNTEGLVLNCVEIPAKIQDMDFPGFGSSTSHTVYRKVIDTGKELYRQVYKLCAYILQ